MSTSVDDQPAVTNFQPANRVVLISIDGWGLKDETKGNAIAEANTQHMDALASKGLFCRLDASGESVGLPDGVMGNSEVGHLTMGAGRATFQDLVRINKSLHDKSFYTNKTLLESFDYAAQHNSRVHFLGLVSDGGVHSHINHLFAFLDAAKQHKVPSTYVHFFADGRDTPPSSGTIYLQQLMDYMKQIQYGQLASVMGRYYAMDRDKRWERTQIAYDALMDGTGAASSNENDIKAYIEKKYEEKETDEFLKPIIVNQEGCIRDNDVMIFIDYRSDRMRQITKALAAADDAKPFQCKVLRKGLRVVQMTQYDENLPLPTVFPPQTNINALPEWISKHGLTQFHTAETEKYAHVTFFFAGGRELQFQGEERGLIPSPKVATYDLAPKMSQAAVGESVIKAIKEGKHPFIVCNLAAPDMVGHTGVYDATVIACTECDRVIGEIAAACAEYNVVLCITSDHGNAEEMLAEDGSPKTAHTTNHVPFIIVPPASVSFRWKSEVTALPAGQNAGGLADVAPTICQIMGMRQPKEMTGKALLDM